MGGIDLLGRRIGNHAKTTDRLLLEAVFGDDWLRRRLLSGRNWPTKIIRASSRAQKAAEFILNKANASVALETIINAALRGSFIVVIK